jgi:ferritin-like metal-binding protein YciE
MKTRNQTSARQTTSSSSKKSSKESAAGLATLRHLFVHELQDLYDAENQLVKALPKIAAAVSSPELKEAIESHLEETREHVRRLEQVFGEIGEKARASHCDGMEGLLAEGKKMMEEDGDEAVIDAGIIAAAQRVEHYEMAGYGCARRYATRLDYGTAVELLGETLDEEKAADNKLTEISDALELDGESQDEEAA